MTQLRLRGYGETLEPGECSFHQHESGTWLMHFRFVRDTDGKTETRIIPVNPNGDAVPQPNVCNDWGKWGIRRTGNPGQWRISPSINCIDQVKGEDGQPKKIEVWHKDNVTIEGVPDWEPWTQENA